MPEVNGAHIHGPPYPLKRNGSCLCCGTPVYRVIEVWQDGPLEGTPRRVGKQLDVGTQVTFQMSDGSEADVSFCIDCAPAVRPAHYRTIWEACLDREALGLRLAGRSANERTAAMARGLKLFPVARVRRRRESEEPGMLMVDRRG